MEWMRRELNDLDRRGLLRNMRAWPRSGGGIPLPDGRVTPNFSSNDYLALANDPEVKRRTIQAVERFGCGATASRLMSGTLNLHEELEAALSRLTASETALVFSSGFGMNVGVVAALAGREDVLFADRLNHASLVDGARLSGAEVKRFAHNDTAQLRRLLDAAPRRRRRLIVCESVYSMDGDLAPLEEIRALADRYGALMVADEAHAIGVFGHGGGLARERGAAARPDVLLGTMGKALGSAGGFVACAAVCRDYLVNRARSFIYATALAPPAAAAALAAVERIEQDSDMGARLLERARAFHSLLREQGLPVAAWRSQIIPIQVGDSDKTVELARRLMGQGLLATAIRPPAAPAGTARLRLSVSLAHAPADLECAAARIGRTAREMGLA
ncbi:MAG: 8-amino-7-oxononanoate synthase [Verrucomicrobiota bacterium]|nr:8-amino-7-oxononanoate synthase [Verrucomicrobiota bacterium]